MNPATAAAPLSETVVFQDGLGERRHIADPAGNETLEILRLSGELTANRAFEFALRERVNRLADFPHACYGHVRSVDRLNDPGATLALVSERTPGVRLSEMLALVEQRKGVLDISGALCLEWERVPAAGTLHAGDYVVVGETMGRVKAMLNEHGKRIKSAGPSAPAEILGLQAVPKACETLVVVADEKTARTMVLERVREREAAAMHQQARVTLDTLFGEISAGKLKELNIILKTDVQGSIEPIRTSLERLTNEQVKVKIIHTGSGAVTESDVMLAIASKGIIIAFNTGTEGGAERIAATEKIDIRHYNIIYKIVEDVDKALTGMLEPTFKEVVTGHAEVRKVFRVARKNSIAGAYVRDGMVTRTDTARVQRNGGVISEGKISTLKRFQEDVRDVQTNFECGIQIDGFDSFEEGDVIEFFRIERET